MEVFHYVAEMLVCIIFLKTEIKAVESIKKEKQPITTLVLTQQSYLVNLLATLPVSKR